MAHGLFQDRIVPSSELNRHSGQVLNQAMIQPITITRPHGDLVLMRRSLAASMAGALDVLPSLTRALATLITPGDPDGEGVAWIDRLSLEDTVSLAVELVDALAPGTRSLDTARAVLHEWAESQRWTSEPAIMQTLHREEIAARRRGSIPVDEAARSPTRPDGA
jgi:hypothetical protein